MSDLRILIVDKTETTKLSNKLFLAKQGYCSETANDGEEALRKIGTFYPELVLLDASISDMDGFECCRIIKSSKSTRDIKVVILSSTNDYYEITQAFAAGCDDYIVKPIDKRELLVITKEILRFSPIRSAKIFSRIG